MASSLTFIETCDDDDDDVVVEMKVDYDDDNGKYDQLSQLNTGWDVVVVFQDEENNIKA
jgi:hypothetical protein